MKLILIAALLFGAMAFAQTPAPAPATPNIFGAGISWNQSASASASQQFAGTLFYARQQTEAGTYAFTVVDAVPTTFKPFTVTTNFGIGIGQRVFQLSKWTVYGTVAAGPSWSGSNTGWAWTGGGMAIHPLKGAWWIGPEARLVRSSVNNNNGNQFIFGVVFGTQQ